MPIGIADYTPGFSAYLQQLLEAWGLSWTERITFGSNGDTDLQQHPLVVCPAMPMSSAQSDQLDRYVHAGGTAICLAPDAKLLKRAGFDPGAPRTGPLRLRVHGLRVQGLRGAPLPIAGGALNCTRPDNAQTLAALYVPDRFEGEDHESPGIVRVRHGDGQWVMVLFDLPRSVMLIRQGDPALADFQFDNPSITRRSCKPTNLAMGVGPFDAGAVPYADLLARTLVDLIIDCLDHPMPTLATTPTGTNGVVLLSGDEDNASLDANAEEMDTFTDAGARMNLYIIPDLTQSSKQDVDRYSQNHDVGPHPNIVPQCDEPAEARIAAYEAQLDLYMKAFDRPARSVRNHAAGWVGYLDLIEVQAKHGIRMDANYFSCHTFRERNHAPFSPFGGALPLKFTRPDGRLIDVYQQPTQLNDDIWFAPDRPYSYHLNRAAAEPILAQLVHDISERFAVPLTTNFHPGNWYFAGEFAVMLLRLAQELGLGCCSLDQWLTFWEQRAGCTFHDLKWDEPGTLSFSAGGARSAPLDVELPLQWQQRTLRRVSVRGREVNWTTRRRLESDAACVTLPAGGAACAIEAVYH